MADDGLGQLEKSLTEDVGGVPVWVIGAGLGVTIVLGVYLYRRASGGGSAVEQVYDPNSDTQDQATDPTNADYGLPNGPAGDWLSDNPGSAAFPVGGTALPSPITNAQWGRYVSDMLLGMGADPGLVSNAIAKYLSGDGLSAAEKAVINQALRILQPPEGVLPLQDVSPTVALTAPANLKTTSVGPTSARLSWKAVPGAIGYRIGLNGTYRETVVLTNTALWGLKKGTKYSVTVAARSANSSTYGPASSVTFTTKAK